MKKNLVEKPLEYWEEKSYMLVIPPKFENDLLKNSLERLFKNEEFEIINNNYQLDSAINIKIKYDGEEYEVGFYAGGLSVPDYYLNKNFLFKETEKEALLKANHAITIFMKFKENVKKSFQIKER